MGLREAPRWTGPSRRSPPADQKAPLGAGRHFRAVPARGADGLCGDRPGGPDPQLRFVLRRRVALDPGSARGRPIHGRPLRPRTRQRLRLAVLRRTRRPGSARTARNSRRPAPTRSAASSSGEGPRRRQVAIDNSGTRRRVRSTSTRLFASGGIGATWATTPKEICDGTRSQTADGGDYHVCGVTTDPSGNVDVANTTPGSGTTTTTTRSPTPTSRGGEGTGPICIARASTGLKYNVFEPNGPLIKARPARCWGRAYAVTVALDRRRLHLGRQRRDGLSSDGIEFEHFGLGRSPNPAVSRSTRPPAPPTSPIPPTGGSRSTTGSRLTASTSTSAGRGSARYPRRQPPIDNCGDEGPCVGYYPPRPSSSGPRRSPTRKSTGGPAATTSIRRATNAP